MSRRRRSDYRLSLGWILGVTFIGTLTRLKLPQWSSLSFGAAVCLRLPPHTTSQRKLSRLATDHATCSCLRLTVATNSLAGGINEHGLAGANLNLPNYTKYQDATEVDDGKIIAGWDVPTYFLTQFKSVQEVRAAVENIKVVFQLWNVAGLELPIEFHYTFHDPSGDSIVLEYIDGAPKIYDNQLGVMTNSPDFEWQRVNLNNYINLTAEDAGPRQIADVALIATGTGSGMLGLPGDYTPPSRFVRTVALTQTALPAKTHAEGLQSAFRISNAISFPEGPARQIMGGRIFAGKTDFQLVADTSNRIMYFRDYNYPNWRSIDLAALAASETSKLVLDPSKGPAISSAASDMQPSD